MPSRGARSRVGGSCPVSTAYPGMRVVEVHRVEGGSERGGPPGACIRGARPAAPCSLRPRRRDRSSSAPRSVRFRLEIGPVPARDRSGSAPRSVRFRLEIGPTAPARAEDPDSARTASAATESLLLYADEPCSSGAHHSTRPSSDSAHEGPGCRSAPGPGRNCMHAHTGTPATKARPTHHCATPSGPEHRRDRATGSRCIVQPFLAALSRSKASSSVLMGIVWRSLQFRPVVPRSARSYPAAPGRTLERP